MLASKRFTKNNMGNLLVGDAKPSDIEDLEERNTVEKEMQAVKILLETGEFDKEMDG
mgnify:CR=1 FL=1